MGIHADVVDVVVDFVVGVVVDIVVADVVVDVDPIEVVVDTRDFVWFQ